MASTTKSTSGNVTTYTVTDSGGNTVAVAITANAITGFTTTFTSTGGLRNDGVNMLAQLLLETGTNLLP